MARVHKGTSQCHQGQHCNLFSEFARQLPEGWGGMQRDLCDWHGEGAVPTAGPGGFQAFTAALLLQTAAIPSQVSEP